MRTASFIRHGISIGGRRRREKAGFEGLPLHEPPVRSADFQSAVSPTFSRPGIPISRRTQNESRRYGGPEVCATSPSPRLRGYAAFTLLEVTISAALMSLIVVSAYLCFNASVAGQKLMEPRLEIIQNARVALALMTADLRAACPLDRNSEFLGMHRMLGDAVADNLDFATHNYTPARAGEGDFCQLSYYLNPDPDTGQLSLWRRRNPAIGLDPLSGGYKEEIATGVSGLQLEYYDGFDWYDTWGDVEGRGRARTSQRTRSNLTGMPEAVRITLWFDAAPRRKNDATASKEDEKPEPPMVFQTIARLNLATTTVTSSSGSSSTTAASESSGQTQPGGQSGGGNQ